MPQGSVLGPIYLSIWRCDIKLRRIRDTLGDRTLEDLFCPLKASAFLLHPLPTLPFCPQPFPDPRLSLESSSSRGSSSPGCLKYSLTHLGIPQTRPAFPSLKAFAHASHSPFLAGPLYHPPPAFLTGSFSLKAKISNVTSPRKPDVYIPQTL